MIDELQLIRSFRAEDAAPDPKASAAAYERLCAHIAATGDEESVRVGDGAPDTVTTAEPVLMLSARSRRSARRHYFVTRWWFWVAAVVSTALGLLRLGRNAEDAPL